MTEPERIVVTVRPDGTISAVTRGIVGDRCLDYVAALEELLDAETTASEFTPDRQRTTVELLASAERTVADQHRRTEF